MKKRRRTDHPGHDMASLIESWADLSNALFDPVDGLFTRASTPEEQEAFLKTKACQTVRNVLAGAVDPPARMERSAGGQSGRFVVRLPQSLHVALQQEAAREGVSLNQLVVAKLAAQLAVLAGQGDGKARKKRPGPR